MISEKKIKVSWDIVFISMILFYPAVSGYLRAIILLVTSRVGFIFEQGQMDVFVWLILIFVSLNYWCKRLNSLHMLMTCVFYAVVLIMFLFGLSGGFTEDRLIELCLFVAPAFLCGAVVVIMADLVGRTLFAPSELPVGIVMSLIGAPYFLILLCRRKRHAANM